MQSKMTPAPWIKSIPDNGVFTISSDETGGVLALVYGLADAKAIAVVPELVKELKAVHDAWFVGMTVEGFAVAIHDLMPNIILALIKAGVPVQAGRLGQRS